MSEKPSTGDAAEPAPRRTRSMGRRIATAMFWALMLYVGFAGLYSLIPQVFWPTASARAEREMPDSCAAGLRELKAELLARASEHVGAGGIPDGATRRRWLHDWDDRYVAMRTPCRGEPAYGELGTLRHRVATFVERFDREHSSLSRTIDDRLDQLQPDDETH